MLYPSIPTVFNNHVSLLIRYLIKVPILSVQCVHGKSCLVCFCCNWNPLKSSERMSQLSLTSSALQIETNSCIQHFSTQLAAICCGISKPRKYSPRDGALLQTLKHYSRIFWGIFQLLHLSKAENEKYRRLLKS